MDSTNYIAISKLKKEKMPVNRNNIEWMIKKMTSPDASKPNLLLMPEYGYEEKEVDIKLDKVFAELERKESEKLNKEIDKVLSNVDEEEAKNYSKSCDWTDLDITPDFHNKRDKKITELLNKISTGEYVDYYFYDLVEMLNAKLYYTSKTIYKSISSFPNFFCLNLRGYEDVQQELTIQIFNFAKTFHDKTYDENNLCKYDIINTNSWFKKISNSYFYNLVRYLNAKSRQDKEFVYLDNNIGDSENSYYNKVGYNESGYDDFELEMLLDQLDLNDNQREVAKLLSQGYSVTDIAELTGRDKANISRTKSQLKKKLTK
ncbi:MAG: hypothetical protein E6240_01870 [Clostridium butyricum]|nr:hypothetical protein [Clostridium butyricum]